MLTVKQLADSLGVSPDVVRYYSRSGLLKPLVSPTNGYRLYDETDAVLLENVRVARSLGFSLKEARAFGGRPREEQASLLRRREDEIEEEIRKLEERKRRLAEIRGFLEKASLCKGFVEEVDRPPIYSLYTIGEGTGSEEAKRRVPAWASNFPFVHISVSVPKRELNDLDFKGIYSTRLGVGVTEAYAHSLGLRLDPPVETVPGGRFLIIYLTVSDLLSISRRDLEPLLERAASLGVRFLNDSTGRLLAVEETGGETRYSILIRVRIGRRTDSA
ncbi:MAG: MerR family transcriptional regulator [Sutterellaceae bacterium]|nr:MerR family transcriptional regulator [Sutterellaceae bacterium]MDD7442903.1 MerR family transcriptional regulator [Sutterellaceae bacterium]MDY2868155.1 MerR family transcriptional regulator [Mesosutterella sp.]